MKKIIRKLLLAGAVFIISAAIIFSIVRACTPWVATWKPDLEKWLGAALGAPVSIGRLETGWHRFKPVITLDHLAIQKADHRPVHIKRLYLSLDWLRSLRYWRIEPGMLYIDHVAITLRQTGNTWAWMGIPVHQSGQAAKNNPFTAWLAEGPKISLQDIQLRLHFAKGQKVTIEHLNLRTLRGWNTYKIRGRAWITDPRPSAVELMADLSPTSFQSRASLNGKIYIAIRDLRLDDWLHHIPTLPVSLRGGECTMQLWATLHKGIPLQAQSQIQLDNLNIEDTAIPAKTHINHLAGNFMLLQSDKTMQWTGDHIDITLNNTVWSDNQLQVDYDPRTQTQAWYVRYLDTDFIATLLPWLPKITPPDLQKTLTDEASMHKKTQAAMKNLRIPPLSWLSKVHGLFQDVHITSTSGTLAAFSGQFTKLHIPAYAALPAIDNLNGALFWTPERGDFILESTDSIVHIPEKKPVQCLSCSAAIHFNKTPENTTYHLEHAVIKLPETTLRAYGDLQWDHEKPVTIHLATTLQASHATRWLHYIPQKVFKPKLERWLTQYIKKINTLSAKMAIQGPLQDFPFDHGTGLFHVSADVTDADLYFAPLWPMVRNLHAHLEQTGRLMTVSAHKALLDKIPVHHVQLTVPDLGLHHEIMQVQGAIKAPFSVAKDYLLHTPLRKPLHFLSAFNSPDPLALTLTLQVPLFPEDNTVQAQGRIHFNNNTLNIQSDWQKLVLNNIQGELPFTRLGIEKSTLSARFLETPLTLTLTPTPSPHAGVQITAESNTPTTALKPILAPQYLSTIQGTLHWFLHLWVPAHTHAIKSLDIQSDLVGLAINLPAPFGKTARERSPLRLEINTADPKQPIFTLHADKKTRLHITKNKNTWNITVHHPLIDGNIQFNPTQWTLQAALKYLRIPAWKKTSHATPWLSIHPHDMPTLALDIQDLQYNNTPLGHTTLTGHYQNPDWILDTLSVIKPATEGHIIGRWTGGKTPQSTIQGQWIIHHLAQNFSFGNLGDMLDAQQTLLSFDAHWPGSFLDAALAHIDATLRLELKQGVIQQLSASAQEKLGIGKLLSILSLQTIPRRLTLDFSDLANKGFTFDRFAGNFTLHNGVLSTQDSALDGPVAYASMKGDIHLAQRQYDLKIKIAPHITASLPLVATIAGGPVVGIAAWIANKMINQVQRITAYTYQLSGSWDAPVVQPLKLYKATQEKKP